MMPSLSAFEAEQAYAASIPKPKTGGSLFKIEIDLGNAAFQDGLAPDEIARILRETGHQIVRHGSLKTIFLYDLNGNKVGQAWVEAT